MTPGHTQTVTNSWQGVALQERAESLSLLINLHVETNMMNVAAVIMYRSIWSSFSLNRYVYNIPTQYLYADQDGRILMVNSVGSEPPTSTILHRHAICCDPTGTLFWRHNAFSLFFKLWTICVKRRGCTHQNIVFNQLLGLFKHNKVKGTLILEVIHIFSYQMHSFIPRSVIWQVRSLFQTQFSRVGSTSSSFQQLLTSTPSTSHHFYNPFYLSFSKVL